jgi:cellulose biosynthesis protein BcsQ
MRVVAFFNHKGGVGKTTLLFNPMTMLNRTEVRRKEHS